MRADLVDAFVKECEDAARWRDLGDDERDAASAAALRAVATWARTDRDAFEILDEALEDVPVRAGRLQLSSSARWVFRGFGYGKPERHERWLRGVNAAMFDEDDL